MTRKMTREPKAETLQNEALAPSPAPAAPSKISMVLAMLQRTEGAALDELVAATGWLPHTTRAALTGLRKKGQVIDKTKRDSKTCYHIEAGA